ncbi:hypothetical protein KIN20_024435 [Parelaphostrongylus tenuis]|uniref:Uncharacterized protein n=1 Tax=Parelaphostrongylus tenuis TaxID=148309 RepID=A0AAD5MY96_PARTN|nr:hypothetical protein KIN20_024435 [Parelaphostrongylus tenuis]
MSEELNSFQYAQTAVNCQDKLRDDVCLQHYVKALIVYSEDNRNENCYKLRTSIALWLRQPCVLIDTGDRFWQKIARKLEVRADQTQGEFPTLKRVRKITESLWHVEKCPSSFTQGVWKGIKIGYCKLMSRRKLHAVTAHDRATCVTNRENDCLVANTLEFKIKLEFYFERLCSRFSGIGGAYCSQNCSTTIKISANVFGEQLLHIAATGKIITLEGLTVALLHDSDQPHIAKSIHHISEKLS